MIKDEFNKLVVLKQLEYINSLLKEGKSLRSISGDLHMSKTTFRDRFFRIGYTRNEDTNQYCKDDTIVIQSQAKTIKTLHKADKPVLEPIKNGNTKELQKYESTKELQKYNDDILELINNKTELLEMLKDYKSNTKIIDMPQLNISSLPEEMQTDIINKSIKIYGPVSKLFDKVCDGYVGYKKQDLISLALYEFCCKYKK